MKGLGFKDVYLSVLTHIYFEGKVIILTHGIYYIVILDIRFIHINSQWINLPFSLYTLNCVECVRVNCVIIAVF